MPNSRNPQTKSKREASGKEWWKGSEPVWKKREMAVLAALMKMQRDRLRPCLICRKDFGEPGTAVFMRPMRNGRQVHVNLGLICDTCREGALHFKGLIVD